MLAERGQWHDLAVYSEQNEMHRLHAPVRQYYSELVKAVKELELPEQLMKNAIQLHVEEQEARLALTG